VNPLNTLIITITKHIEHLNKLNEDVIKKLGHFEYPIRNIL
jgi:hypothetical protein